MQSREVKSVIQKRERRLDLQVNTTTIGSLCYLLYCLLKSASIVPQALPAFQCQWRRSPLQTKLVHGRYLFLRKYRACHRQLVPILVVDVLQQGLTCLIRCLEVNMEGGVHARVLFGEG